MHAGVFGILTAIMYSNSCKKDCGLARFKDAIALKENLVDNVKALKARLTELVQSRDEWKRCHNASLQSAGRFSLDTIVKQYYEPLRDYVLQHCGCDSAGPT